MGGSHAPKDFEHHGGFYTVKAEKSGFEILHKTVNIESNAEVMLNFTLID